jgi:hypothetical protein
VQSIIPGEFAVEERGFVQIGAHVRTQDTLTHDGHSSQTAKVHDNVMAISGKQRVAINGFDSAE